jgi:hypothetical protein
MLENREKKFFIYSQQCRFTMFSLAHNWQSCVILLSILGSILKFSGKKSQIPVLFGPGQHALDTDPDPDPDPRK